MSPDTIAALATPRGTGAVAVVRLSGPDAWAAVSTFLDSAGRPEARRATLAWALDGGRRLDQVVVTLFPGGASYTGEEVVELSCHGSPFVVERLLALCRAAGARDARPGEFTQRAFLNGRLDLAQAEAVCDLIAARSADEHRAAVGQLEGGLSRRVEALRAELLDLAALVEANLDHPDEDIPPVAAAEAARRAEAARGAVEALLATRHRSRLGKEAPRVVLLGAPNAGKSSLLNALLGEDRALVSPEPGTTRDAVEAALDLDGVACAVVDTAGLREAGEGTVEGLGIERARAQARAADLALLVIDRAGEPAEAAAALRDARALAPAGRLAVVFNKADLPARVDADEAAPLEAVSVSALTGDGVDALVSLARRRLAGADHAGNGVSERHALALEKAGKACALAAAQLRAGAEELAARELRAALTALDSIVGKDTPEEVLGAVFSRFCIGK